MGAIGGSRSSRAIMTIMSLLLQNCGNPNLRASTAVLPPRPRGIAARGPAEPHAPSTRRCAEACGREALPFQSMRFHNRGAVMPA